MNKSLLTFAKCFLFLGFSVTVGSAQDRLSPHISLNDLSLKKQMRRLDSAAKIIESQPNHIFWLVGNNTTGKNKSTVILRLKKSKQYLIKKHKISAERINMAYGGQSDEGMIVDIFIVPKESPNPVDKENIIN